MKIHLPTSPVALVLPACGAAVLLLASSCSEGSNDSAGSGGQVTLAPDDEDPIVVPSTDGESSGGSPGTGGEGGSANPPALTLCETAAGHSVSALDGDPVLDDFEDGDAIPSSNGRVGFWYAYGDGTGTLSPYGEVSPSEPGRGGSAYALHVSGVDFTYWGSGVGTGLAKDDVRDCLHDLSAYTGISFWARGNVSFTSEGVVERDRNVVRLLLVEADVAPVEEGGGCTGDAGGCWDSHRVRFSPGECWELVSFDFSEFAQDGWGQDGGELDLDELYRLHFEVAAYNDWDVWLDDIGFYVGDKPVAPSECGLGGEGGGSGQ